MARTPMIAGNWKMYKNTGEAVSLAQKVVTAVADARPEVDVVLCPPFTALKSVANVIEFDRSDVKLGAQDVHWAAEGAYTGEVSPSMLSDIGCDYCIVGHSERREMFGETDETVNKKVHALFAAGIKPIVCCGESLETRDAGDTYTWVVGQVMDALHGVTPIQAADGLVVAYEPIWAIGTGRVPTPEAAGAVCSAIRAALVELFGSDAASKVRILYGGSVKPENIGLFMPETDIDGALVGGAALESSSFMKLVEGAAL